MTTGDLDFDESSILRRLDRTSPETLLKSLVMELARLGQAHTLLRARLAAMESLQTMADRIAASARTELFDSYPCRVFISAENSNIDTHGFHYLEHDSDGTAFRWTGPDRQFSFQFFINRLIQAHFVLRIDRIYADAPVEGLKCFIDGEPAELVFLRHFGCYEVRGVLPRRENSGGSVLTFICPQMLSPQSRGETDTRLLGALFRSLVIETQALSEQQSAAAPGPFEVATPAFKPPSVAATSLAAGDAPDGDVAAPHPEDGPTQILAAFLPDRSGASVFGFDPKPREVESKSRLFSTKEGQ